MNKRLIIGIRIILYSLALYVVLDLFIFSSDSEDKTLTVFEKNQATIYWEYFVKFRQEDSTWVAIQTAPIIQSPIEIGKKEAWSKDIEKWEVFRKLNLKLSGFYLTESYILDRKSFFIIVNQIDEMKNNEDPNLNKLNRYKSFTIVLEQENKL